MKSGLLQLEHAHGKQLLGFACWSSCNNTTCLEWNGLHDTSAGLVDENAMLINAELPQKEMKSYGDHLAAGKLTMANGKLPMFSRKCIFSWSIFHCYFSLPEGNLATYTSWSTIIERLFAAGPMWKSIRAERDRQGQVNHSNAVVYNVWILHVSGFCKLLIFWFAQISWGFHWHLNMIRDMFLLRISQEFHSYKPPAAG